MALQEDIRPATLSTRFQPGIATPARLSACLHKACVCRPNTTASSRQQTAASVELHSQFTDSHTPYVQMLDRSGRLCGLCPTLCWLHACTTSITSSRQQHVNRASCNTWWPLLRTLRTLRMCPVFPVGRTPHDVSCWLCAGLAGIGFVLAGLAYLQ